MPDNKNKPNQSKIRTIDKIEQNPVMNQFMDIIRLKESSDRSGIRNPTIIEGKKSTAYGYYQVIGSTLDAYNNKYGTKYTLNTREEQHEFMRLMMLESQQFFRKNNIPETLENYYKKHVIGDNVKFLKFIKAEQSGGNLSNYLTQKEINANPGLFKDEDGRVLSVGEANKQISSFINSGKQALNKQSTERKKQVELEKRGIYEGRATPLDKRPGNYINDGKAEWDPNAKYFNGTKLGEQSNDFVVSVNGDKKKVIMQGSKQESDVDSGFTPKGYDYESAKLYDDSTWGNSTPSTASSGFDLSQVDPNLQSFNMGPSDMDLSINQIRNPQIKNQGQPQLSRADILNATATYANEKNPYTSAGNIPHLVEQDQKGNPVIMNNPNNLNVNSDTYLNANIGNLTNPDNPQAQQQYEQGGNLNNNNMNKAKNKAYEEGNDGLISFNEGGTHEENPYGGIPQNNNPDGSLNVVEQGETKQGDYVFSDNLKITKQLAEELRLPKQVEDKTFAEASKILNKALEENENDPIVKRTVDKQLDSLKLGNEKAKEENNLNQEQLRQAQFEIDNVDALNDLEKEVNNIPQEPIQQPMQPNQGFSEQDLNMFTDGGDLELDDATKKDNLNNGIASGIEGGLNLASTLAFSDDPNQEAKIKPGQTALKGATAGLSMGASLGSVIPGLGTAIGAAAGAVIGGVGGLIVGNSKAKKQEKIFRQKEQQRQDRALAPFRDPRSESGFIEDREVFTDGGPLKRGTGITYNSFDENDLNNLYDLNLNFNNDLVSDDYDITNDSYFNDTLDEMVIDVPRKVKAITPDPLSIKTGALSDSPHIGYDRLANPKEEEEDKEKSFRPRGENLLQYAGLLGSYQDMRNANAKQPVVEKFRASGTRMNPYEIDVNNIMSELRYSANTADNILQRNANGNSAIARASILANRNNTNNAIGEALFKAQEYNNNQRQTALQYNNRLDQYFDKMFNDESQINSQNRSALDRERAVRRQQFLTNLSNLGKEQSNRNAAYNLSGGYDRYGNKNGNMLDALIEAIQKNNK